MKKRLVILAALVTLILSGCAKPQTAWITDLDAAKAQSTKTHKDLLIVFTGSDWNDPSKELIANIFTPDFFKKGTKNYVMCNLDIVQDKTLLDEATIEKNFGAATTYGVTGLPFVVLQTPEGDMYGKTTATDETGATDAKFKTADSMFEHLASFKDARKKLVDMKKAIKSAKGSDRATKIDTFIEALDQTQREQYSSFIREVPALDPENKTGLVGKYTLQIAYLDSIELYKTGKLTEAADCFVKAVDGNALDGAQKQEALYMTAYLSAMSGTVDNAKVIGYLEQAIAADPQNPGVTQLQNTIEQIKKAPVNPPAASN